MSFSNPARPGILGPLAFCSLLLSFLNVVWILILAVVAILAGAVGWLFGPVVGVLGSLVVGLFVLMLLVQSLLSLLLFLAAWKTWRRRPSGRSLHLTWAWITVILDLLDLAFTAGIDGGAWIRLIYAMIVIFVFNRDDVRAYFARGTSGLSPAKATAVDDWS
ncbi:hypothetical protein [Tautonia rosea]|uniref:hypothetical protein n=1 Tax=Tautonia rosea TaxID=2728037 RepID=UPI001472F8B4|nr:hypothetical protein [Tautonia rosea]